MIKKIFTKNMGKDDEEHEETKQNNEITLTF